MTHHFVFPFVFPSYCLLSCPCSLVSLSHFPSFLPSFLLSYKVLKLVSTLKFVTVGTPPDLQALRRRRAVEERQRSPSPSSISNHHASKKGSIGPMSPRDRFKDAKEKFLLLEEQEKQMQRRRNLQTAVEPPISPAVLPTAGNSRGEKFGSSCWYN